jgi:hypothetical protein
MTSLTNSINYSDVTIYSPSSAKAILYGLQGKFTGKDSDGNKIVPSGSGKNEGKFLLKDVRKCPSVQKWIKEDNIEGEKEVKIVNKFSSKSAEKLFNEKFPGLDVKDWQGTRTGKRTKGSITCQDIKNFLKSNGEQAVVSDDKKFTTKKMKQKIDVLGQSLKTLANEYLKENPGNYKGNKVWGKKEVEAAIEYAMQNC